MTNEELHKIHDDDTKLSAEDAIEVLRHPAEFESTDAMNIACNMAIEALKKQIPNKPIDCEFPTNLPDGIMSIKTVCPSCGSELLQWNIQYKICGCGQKIDWSVEWSK